MNNSILKQLLSVLGIIALIYGIYIFSSLLAYLIVSIALSFAGRPIVKAVSGIKFKGKNIPSSIGAVVALLSFAIAGTVIVGMFGPLVAAQVKNISQINPHELASDVKGWLSFLDSVTKQVNFSDSSFTSFLLDQTPDLASLSGVSSIFSSVLSFLGNAFIAIFSILFMTFFFLKDAGLFYKMVVALTPEDKIENIEKIMESSSKLLTRYFSGLLIQMTIVTVMVSSGLAIVGVENAVLLGFIAGVFNLIPYIGPIASTLIGLVIVLTTFNGDYADMAPHLGYALIVYMITQLVDNFFTQPVIFSNMVKAHPLEIFIVISMAGLLGGVYGMILAVPTYTLLRIVASEFLSGNKVVDALTKGIEEK
jgi:predicted PurR-regulated permease PerM